MYKQSISTRTQSTHTRTGCLSLSETSTYTQYLWMIDDGNTCRRDSSFGDPVQWCHHTKRLACHCNYCNPHTHTPQKADLSHSCCTCKMPSPLNLVCDLACPLNLVCAAVTRTRILFSLKKEAPPLNPSWFTLNNIRGVQNQLCHQY